MYFYRLIIFLNYKDKVFFYVYRRMLGLFGVVYCSVVFWFNCDFWWFYLVNGFGVGMVVGVVYEW